ncbi:hypothetical protein L207DRAFT_124308 [Hyaloscypha variabilis F]|uniref:Uncharacterized protein n=1 Tax=Hyaloscypha variabilis (strain UAMH 11265 / GT02V1 / F) TaxID=1149755 RepID=A0A2J6R817_HYAVF|nr:hypothetical protein L207DRAFT_124308 [Hyaloscypha variabilis F]
MTVHVLALQTLIHTRRLKIKCQLHQARRFAKFVKEVLIVPRVSGSTLPPIILIYYSLVVMRSVPSSRQYGVSCAILTNQRFIKPQDHQRSAVTVGSSSFEKINSGNTFEKLPVLGISSSSAIAVKSTLFGRMVVISKLIWMVADEASLDDPLNENMRQIKT